MDKKCYKCKDVFPQEMMSSNGYCKSCHSIYRREHYLKNIEKEKDYREKVRDKMKLYLKDYYSANKDVISKKYAGKAKEYYERTKQEKMQKQKIYRSGNKQYQQYFKDYAEKNRKHINEYSRNYTKHKRETDPEFKILSNIRARFTAALKVKGLRKHSRTKDLIGCDIFTLREHLESKFLPTMTWENYGELWHIDHVIPCTKFDLTTKEGQKACFHYNNLQPLFASTTIIDGIEYIGNLNKGGKYEH